MQGKDLLIQKEVLVKKKFEQPSGGKQNQDVTLQDNPFSQFLITVTININLELEIPNREF